MRTELCGYDAAVTLRRPVKAHGVVRRHREFFGWINHLKGTNFDPRNQLAAPEGFLFGVRPLAHHRVFFGTRGFVFLPAQLLVEPVRPRL